MDLIAEAFGDILLSVFFSIKEESLDKKFKNDRKMLVFRKIILFITYLATLALFLAIYLWFIKIYN